MRNGRKAVVVFRRNDGKHPWTWIGHTEESSPHAWRDNGQYCVGEGFHHELDLVSPWTSPIAPGHNPDKLTVEQVGEGWWLPEWEILEKVTELQRLKYLEFWSGHIQKWLHAQGAGHCCSSVNYRTRLTRDELLAIITPKKRLIRVEELPPVCWVGDEFVHWFVSERDCVTNKIRSCSGRSFHISEFKNVKWSSNLKTWHSFEVEDDK